jgi:hypothetical protein
MIPRKDLYIIAAVFALLFFGNSYLSTLRDSAKQDQLKQDVKAQVETLKSDLASKLDAITKDKEQVKTPAQIAVTVPKYTPEVHPILVIPGGVPTEPSNVPTVSLPDAPSAIQSGSLIIPRDEVPAYWKSVTSCAENSANLIACEGELPLQTKRAESAEKALKGGSFWSKVKRSAVYLGIGAAAGYVAAKH